MFWQSTISEQKTLLQGQLLQKLKSTNLFKKLVKLNIDFEPLD